MAAYILRLVGTKQFVGFYTADTEDELINLINEEIAPGRYEYAVIQGGYGVEFRKGGAHVKYEIGKGNLALAKALAKADYIYLTKEAHFALYSGWNLTWKRLRQG